MKYKVFHLEEDWMYFLIMLNEYVILNEIFTNLKEGKKKKKKLINRTNCHLKISLFNIMKKMKARLPNRIISRFHHQEKLWNITIKKKNHCKKVASYRSRGSPLNLDSLQIKTETLIWSVMLWF